MRQMTGRTVVGAALARAGLSAALAFVAALAPSGAAEATRSQGGPSPLARAEELGRRAARSRDPMERERLLGEAEAACARARAEAPQDPRPLLVLAGLHGLPEIDHPERCRPGACERALAVLEQARTLDVHGVEAEHVASERGIVLSRLGRFEEALAAYDEALRLVESERWPGSLDDGGRRARLLGNSAETLMALGRLGGAGSGASGGDAGAIGRYRAALALVTPGDQEWQLAAWGLAVALDRDGQAALGRRLVERILQHDPTMGRLSEENVFFEPPGDQHYYLGLGHEVAGDRALALAAFRAYLASPTARYASRAKEHVAALAALGPDRGPDPARVRVTFGDPHSWHELRKSADLRAAVAQREGDLRLCYVRAQRARPAGAPALRGEVRLLLELSPGGLVMPRPRTVSDLDAPALLRCIELAALAWRFPPTDAPVPEEIHVVIGFEGMGR